MNDDGKKVKQLEEQLFKGAYSFSQHIAPHHKEEADALMVKTDDELKAAMGEKQYQSIKAISERLHLDLSAFDKMILSHYDFEKLASEFVGFISAHRDELRREFSKEIYSARTPDEWLEMDVWDAWQSPEYLQAMSAIQGGKPPRTILKDVVNVNYPLDKIDSEIWSYFEKPNSTPGQLKVNFNVGTARRGKKREKKDPLVVFSISFEGLELSMSKKLTQYDKRVYIACDALWKAGNRSFSISQLYRAMGNTGTPSAAQAKKMNDSLSKMRVTIIHLDNQLEVNAGYKYPLFTYDAALLPFERVIKYFGNNITDAAVNLLERPPMSEFAERSGQVTQIPRELLQSPVSKTEKNLTLDDYLLERIGHMKNDTKNPRKILLSTLYEKCNVTERKDRQRTPEKLRRFLEHYKKCGWITDFSIDDSAVHIKL